MTTSNFNNSELTNYDPTLGLSRARLLGTTGEKQEPIYRLFLGAPATDNPAYDNQYYLKRWLRTGKKDSSGKDISVEQISKPLGGKVTITALGYTLERNLGEFIQATQTTKQYCHSADFMNPDQKFKGAVLPNGTVADVCQIAIPVTSYGRQVVGQDGKPVFKMEVICPLAKWGKTPDGKPITPACNEIYVIFGCIQAELPVLDDQFKPTGNYVNELVVIEIPHKVMTAKDGKEIVRKMGVLEESSIPISTMSLVYGYKRWTLGRSLQNAMLVENVSISEYNEATAPYHESLEPMYKKMYAAQFYRANRANYVDPTASNSVNSNPSVTASNPANNTTIDAELLI